MKIYSAFVILTADIEKQTKYVLSHSDKDILIPLREISTPRYIHNECRYLVKNFFIDQAYTFTEQISFSYIDLQNEFLLEYLSKIENQSYDIENDLFILYGGIFEKKPVTNLYWKEFNYPIDLTTKNPMIILIDSIISKSIL